MPLQEALSVCEVAGLLGMGRAGQKEDLGLNVLSTDLARLVLGRVLQNVADSIGWKSRTTSQSSLAKARRMSLELAEPTVGFWPTQNIPLTPPSSILSIIA